MRRNYADLTALEAADQWLLDHYHKYGYAERRIPTRLRVVITHDATALLDAETAHDRLSDQMYSLIALLALAMHTGAEAVRSNTSPLPSCARISMCSMCASR